MTTLGVTPRGSTNASLRKYWKVTSHGSPTVVPSGGGLSEMPVFATAAAGSRASRTMAVAIAFMVHLQPATRSGSRSAHRACDPERGALGHMGLESNKQV